MTHKVKIDFETYSECDLKKHGLSRYVRHPSTIVQCLVWKIDDGPKNRWVPFDDETPEPMPFELRFAIENDYEVHAHNAAFEIAIWRHFMVRVYGWIAVPSRAWRCTAAKCAYANLPRSLQKISDLFGLGDKGKDSEGHKIMLKLCKPQRGVRVHSAELFDKLVDYCERDVEAEGEVDELTPVFPNRELSVWRLDRKINERGVPVDLALARGATRILREAARRADARLSELTGGTETEPGAVTAVGQVARILEFVKQRGYRIDNLRKATLDAIDFAKIDDRIVAEILLIRRRSALASVKKMQATLDWTDEDSRCRNTCNYYSASTGRWGGRGPQFQNMVRGTAPTEDVLGAIASGDWAIVESVVEALDEQNGSEWDGDIFSLISTATRSIIKAPKGRKLVISDFASIEARVLHWVCGDTAMLEHFVNGTDVYKIMASRIFKIAIEDVTKEQRQIGKIAVLGLGYGMGAIKFAMYARLAGADITDEFAQGVVEIYRGSNPKVPEFWRSVEKSAMLCVQTGKPVVLPRLKFRIETTGEDREWLVLTLPSGRDLYYYRPELARDGRGYRLSYASRIGRKDLYGGLICENIVQAIARDLLSDALLRIDRCGIDLVLHVHDEAVAECDLDDDTTPKRLHEAMETVAPWASGCPVKAETHTSERYTK